MHKKQIIIKLLKDIILSIVVIIIIPVVIYFIGIKIFNINYPLNEFIFILIIGIITYLVVFTFKKFFNNK